MQVEINETFFHVLFQTHITRCQNSVDNAAIYFRNQTLCTTVMGNSVPLLTITSYPASNDREAIEAFSEYNFKHVHSTYYLIY